MMAILKRAALMSFASLLAASVLTSCATLRGSRRIDVGPFAQNTLGMVGELQKFNRPAVWTRLNKYKGLPSVVQVQEDVGRVRRLMRGVALYSSQVASLYESPLSEEKKISELARYLNETIRPNLPPRVVAEFHVTEGFMDTLVMNIRARKTLLEALGAAQPLVNIAVSVGDGLLDEVEEGIRVASSEISSRINEDFGPLVARIEELDAMHVASVKSFVLLQHYRSGDSEALEGLRSSDPGIRPFLPAGRSPTTKDLAAAERFIIERTTTIKSVRDQLEPEYSVYRESQAELQELRTQSDERARLGRMTLVLWGRSHRNLAAGIPVPPMIDVMGVMKSTVNTGIKGIVP